MAAQKAFGDQSSAAGRAVLTISVMRSVISTSLASASSWVRRPLVTAVVEVLLGGVHERVDHGLHVHALGGRDVGE